MIKDYPNQRIVGLFLGPGGPWLHSGLAVALGLAPSTHPLELVVVMRARFNTPVKPVLVGAAGAPCKEVICKDDDANLLSLASPWIKKIDGGRYIGTWEVVVTKDPETGRVNWGTYRCMVKDEKSFAILLHPAGHHGGEILAKYEAAGKPMPIALVIGADPFCHIAAIAPLAYSEADGAGGLKGEGVPLVKCEPLDLEVPADAEIVVEAEIQPHGRVEEGPFGGVHRSCLASRPEPRCGGEVYQPPEKPDLDHRQHRKAVGRFGCSHVHIVQSAVAKNWLEANGVAVKAIYYPGPVLTTAIVSVTPKPGLLKKIVSVLRSGYRLFLAGTGIVFVDEDVDVTNLEDVWWAISTRLHPKRFEVLDGMLANPLIPYLSPEEQEKRETSQWMMNATFPYEWPQEYRATHTQMCGDFESGWSEEVKRKALERWEEYGYRESCSKIGP